MHHEESEELQVSIHHISNSLAWLLLRLFGIMFVLDTLFVVMLWFALLLPADYYTSSLIALWIAFTLKFLFQTFLLYRLIVPWGGTQYYLQDDRLIRYRGFVRRDIDIYDLQNLKAVTMHQGWFGRRFNYGDLDLTIASSGYKEDLRLGGVFEPKKYERVFREYLRFPQPR